MICFTFQSKPILTLTKYYIDSVINIFHFVCCKTILFQSNKNTAVVEYVPRGEDHEKFLSCRGVNPHLPNLAVEDQWKIIVHGKLHNLFVEDTTLLPLLYEKVRLMYINSV